MDALGAALAPLALSDAAAPDSPHDAGSACGSPCSVASDCSSVASADFDGLLSPSAPSSSAGPPSLLSDDLPAAATEPNPACSRSVFALASPPLWGLESIQGRRPEMEDAAAVVPRFYRIPLWMVAADAAAADGLDRASFRLPAHFFAVYDGHGGAQVADYCRDRLHAALAEDLRVAEERVACGGSEGLMSSLDSKKRWEKAFVDCFCRVDAEAERGPWLRTRSGRRRWSHWSARRTSSSPTVGTREPCSAGARSHCLCLWITRQCLTVAPLLSAIQPNREDEYARIEALGGKVIQWNGYRVLGVLAMSRSIGDRYLKPYIIPVPEVRLVARARDDECLVLASDGLWDVLSNEEVCDAARKRILLWHKKNATSSPSASAVARGSCDDGGSPDPAAQAAAKYLSKLALQKGSKDNITVLVVDLKVHRRFRSKT
ncbi:hypothetical protein ACQ4PT_029230 [Festuca glaucescens]